MIYPLAGILIGALLGGLQAKRREGNRLDIAQWAGVGGMVGGILGLFLLVLLIRLG